MPRRRFLRALMAVAVVAALIAAAPAAAADPWYQDVYGHWAETYTRCLWEEGIADGSVEYLLTFTPGWGLSWEWQSRFFPDRAIDRAQFTMLLAKAFRLDPVSGQTGFPDVPPGYRAYPGKDAQPYVDAARLAGLVKGYADGYFRPAQSITREEAVAILIRGLGLGEYAHSLPPEEITSLLSRFGDGHTVSPALRLEMAAAIKLKIIEGYPTIPYRTVQPLNNLTRAEAATIVYRSCLLVLTASPNPFSPDADGVDDCTLVSVFTLHNRSIRAWEINVTDYGGQILRCLGQGGGQPPPVLVWSGVDNHGKVLPDGLYYLTGNVVDGNYQVHQAAMHPVRLEKKSLWGSLGPTLVRPGQVILVTAATTGGAYWVKAGPAPVTAIHLTPIGSPATGQNWQGAFAVPIDAPDGTRPVALTAGFDRTQRSVPLAYTVYQPMSMVAGVVPDPAPAGTEATLWAEVDFPATAVTGSVSGLPAFGLAPVPGHPNRWSASFAVHPNWPAGPRPVLVTGYMPGRSRTVEIAFRVERTGPLELQFFLDD
ncbi:MAG: S-layer homology domain-containing protein [bacterium]|nr:S-layer homology domain-containing protein [bacterium]